MISHLLTIADKAAAIAVRGYSYGADDFKSEAYLALIELIRKSEESGTPLPDDRYIKRAIVVHLMNFRYKDKLIPVPRKYYRVHGAEAFNEVIQVDHLMPAGNAPEWSDDDIIRGKGKPHPLTAPPAAETVDEACTEYYLTEVEANIVRLTEAGYEKKEIASLMSRTVRWIDSQINHIRDTILERWREERRHVRQTGVRPVSPIKNEDEERERQESSYFS